MGTQSILVKIGLGQTFESIFTTVPHGSGRGGDVIEVYSADRREIFGQWRVAGQDLTDLVDDGVASSTEGLDDLKLDGGSVEIVVAVEMTGGNRKKSNPFTLKIKTLTDNITWEENVLHSRRMSGRGSGVLGRDIDTGGDVERRKNGTGGRDAGGVRGKRDGRRPRRSEDGGGKIDGEHGVGCPCGTIGGQMTTSTIGRLSGGARLRIL